MKRLEATKIGGRWIVSAASVERRRESPARPAPPRYRRFWHELLKRVLDLEKPKGVTIYLSAWRVHLPSRGS